MSSQILKIFAISVTLTLGLLELDAQELVNEFGVRIKDPEDVQAVADTNGAVAFFIDGHRQYQATIISANNALERNVSVNKLPSAKKDKLVDIMLNDKSFAAFFYNKKSRTITSIAMDRATGDYKTHVLKTLAKEDLFLRGFAMNNTFYMITVPKNENELFLHECIDGVELKTKKYAIPFKEFYKHLSIRNDKLNVPAESEVGIEVITSYLDNSVKSTYPKKKLYAIGKQIIMTFDDPDGTHLVRIDMGSKKADYQRLNFSLEKGNDDHQKTGNSFLLDKTLFRTTLSSGQMNLAVINIDNMGLANNLNFYPDQEIGILNTPILQDNDSESLFDAVDGKEINKTKRYFNKVLDGNIAIAANKIDSGRLELEVGSYEETVYRNNSLAPGGLAMGMGMGIGMGMGYGMGGFGNPMYSPGGMMGYPGYYNNAPATVVRRIVSFRSMFNERSYQHMPGEMPKTIRERVNKYMNEKFVKNPPELFCLSYRNSATVLVGYYVGNKNQFSVVEFSRFDE